MHISRFVHSLISVLSMFVVGLIRKCPRQLHPVNCVVLGKATEGRANRYVFLAIESKSNAGWSTHEQHSWHGRPAKQMHPSLQSCDAPRQVAFDDM